MLHCPGTHHLPCLPPMDSLLQTGTGEARALVAGSRNRPKKESKASTVLGAPLLPCKAGGHMPGYRSSLDFTRGPILPLSL